MAMERAGDHFDSDSGGYYYANRRRQDPPKFHPATEWNEEIHGKFDPKQRFEDYANSRGELGADGVRRQKVRQGVDKFGADRHVLKDMHVASPELHKRMVDSHPDTIAARKRSESRAAAARTGSEVGQRRDAERIASSGRPKASKEDWSFDGAFDKPKDYFPMEQSPTAGSPANRAGHPGRRSFFGRLRGK